MYFFLIVIHSLQYAMAELRSESSTVVDKEEETTTEELFLGICDRRATTVH